MNKQVARLNNSNKRNCVTNAQEDGGFEKQKRKRNVCSTRFVEGGIKIVHRDEMQSISACEKIEKSDWNVKFSHSGLNRIESGNYSAINAIRTRAFDFTISRDKEKKKGRKKIKKGTENRERKRRKR